MSRKLFFIGLVAAVAIAAAGAVVSSASITAKSGSTLTVALGSIGLQLDPQREVGANSLSRFQAVFDPLTFIAANGAVQPDLAVSWKRLSDVTWRFNLRRGVKFSNGEPFRSADVVFSINRVLSPATASPVLSKIATVSRAIAKGPYTVWIITKAPDQILPRRLSNLFIIPSTYFQKVGAKAFASRALGTGPYKVTAYTPSTSMTLSRVSTSWRHGSFKSIKLLQIPDASTRIAALERGDVDVIGGVTPDLVSSLKHKGLQIDSGLEARTCMINLNYQYGGPLAKKAVRQALNYAVDKDAIVKQILDGYGQATAAWGGPAAFGYDKNLKPYPYNPTKAKQLLAEAGYPNGFSITLDGTNGYYIDDQQVIQAVTGYLQNVGVHVNINTQDSATYLTQIFSGAHKSMLFQCLNAFPGLDVDFILGLYKSTFQGKWYSNPAYDTAYAKSTTILDPAKRQAALYEAQKILYNDAATIQLYTEPIIWAARPSVHGLVARPDTLLYFDPMRKS